MKKTPEDTVDYSSLERLTNKYLKNSDEVHIDIDRPMALVKSYASPGVSKFIDVEDLPDLKKLPKLPEHKRDFSFRFATEHKSWVDWGRVYGVNPSTIRNWLKDPGVITWIAVTKMERKTWMYGQRLNLERKTFEVMNKLLDMRITVDNAKEVLDTVRFVYGVVNGEATSESPKALNTMQVQINTNAQSEASVAVPKTAEGFEYTPEMMAEVREENIYLEDLKKSILENEANATE